MSHFDFWKIAWNVCAVIGITSLFLSMCVLVWAYVCAFAQFDQQHSAPEAWDADPMDEAEHDYYHG